MAADMSNIATAVVIGLLLIVIAVATMMIRDKLPLGYRQEDTRSFFRHIVDLFILMTSLALGFMVSSAESTFESFEQNLSTFSIQMIQLDRMLVHYGSDARDARQQLRTYVERTLNHAWPHDSTSVESDPVAERLLDDVGNKINAIRPSNNEQIILLQDMRQKYQRVVELRWIVVERSDGTIPAPLIVTLVVWLMLMFASFGYMAPRNAVTVVMLTVAAVLISSSLYLIEDLDIPTSGPIQASPAPLQRVLTEIQRIP